MWPVLTLQANGLLFDPALTGLWGVAGMTLFAGFLFLVGCCLGSFANACAMRLVRDEDFILSASRCRGCDRRLRWHDNLPLVGYLKQRGRCGQCGASFSVRYLVVELLGGLFVLGYAAMLPPAMALGFSIGLVFVAVSCLTDLESLTLHPALLTVFGLTGLSLALLADFNLFAWHLSSAQALTGIIFAAAAPILINALYRAVRGQNGFGEGDFWLLGAMGAWLGPFMGFGVFLAASWLGAIYGMVMLARRRASAMTRLPFGLFAGIAFILWSNLFTRVF